jgi:hypothetical protein
MSGGMAEFRVYLRSAEQTITFVSQREGKERLFEAKVDRARMESSSVRVRESTVL